MYEILHKLEIKQIRRVKEKIMKRRRKRRQQADKVNNLPEPARVCIRKKARDPEGVKGRVVILGRWYPRDQSPTPPYIK